MTSRARLGLLAAVMLSGCAYVGVDGSPTAQPTGPASPPTSPDQPTPTSATPPALSPSGSAPSAFVYEGAIPLCDDVPLLQAPADWYRDSPIYVANEMPIERVKAFARSLPGFEEIWIDRDKNGWITVFFRSNAAARQAELEERFPDVGVVAVEIDWTVAQLEALQRRIGDELRSRDLSRGSGIWVQKGVVSIGIGPLTDERVTAVEALFADERVCLEGFDPSLLPADGPQLQHGDGWRLLADQDKTGHSNRTGIAYDEKSYAALWQEARVVGDRPPVDFETEVVIWFGAVHSGSCPRQRLDGVVVDHEAALVHADIVSLDAWGVCTSDAVPHAYLVAVERTKLPVGPFMIQLNAHGPPPGAPEERTVVNVDLSAPSSVAGPGDITGGPPDPTHVGPGGIYETGYEFSYQQPVRCGLEWLGPLNAVDWRTDAAAGTDWIPEEWRSAVDGGTIVLEVIIETGNPPTLRATANGHSVVYRASPDEPPPC